MTLFAHSYWDLPICKMWRGFNKEVNVNKIISVAKSTHNNLAVILIYVIKDTKVYDIEIKICLH